MLSTFIHVVASFLYCSFVVVDNKKESFSLWCLAIKENCLLAVDCVPAGVRDGIAGYQHRNIVFQKKLALLEAN